MEFGFVGLGRMGANMARRLRRAGVALAGHDRDPDVTAALAAEIGLNAASSVAELIVALSPPRVVWLMLPAGDATGSCVDELGGLLAPGDLLVDGGNAFYRDSLRRAEALAALDIDFVDAGVSGGIHGLDSGYSMMLGGNNRALARLQPYLRALAPQSGHGWVHCGPAGSGHFTKMVHNGIEYGMMQAYAEGFSLLRAHPDFDLDLAAIAESWRHGSVVRSWLLDLTAEFLAADQTLDGVEPFVADSGEGRWTALEAIERGIPAPVMTLALMARFASRGHGAFGDRMLAMMRRGFGGHTVKPAD